MKRILIAILKIFAACALAIVAWFPFGGIMWSKDPPPSEPVTGSPFGSIVFIAIFTFALYLIFRRRKLAPSKRIDSQGTK